MSSVVVLDNGGGLIKAGFGGDRDPVTVVPNCFGRPSSSKKWLVADQLLAADSDITSVSLRRPFDRGYLINPDLQKEIWDRVIRTLLRADPATSSLLLVEPLFNPPSIQRATDEVVFEDLGFQSLFVADAPSLVHLYEASRRLADGLAAMAQCSLVVDCGFSFTHAAPVVQNFTLNYGVRRLDLGGKALTNYLKELVSYRSINLMDETLIIDDAKEKLCFVSLDVPNDLQLARKSGKDNPFRCTYVLPDGITHTRGFVKDIDEAQRFLLLPNGSSTMLGMQVVDGQADTVKTEDKKRMDMNKNEFNLTNERFLVPEMIFCPADLGLTFQIGVEVILIIIVICCGPPSHMNGHCVKLLLLLNSMNQAGLAECIVRAVHACHPHLHPVLFESIILTGGSTLFPRFAERLEKDLRPLVRNDYRVKITCQEDPIKGVWRGGSLLASSPDFESMCISKLEYEELGSTRCRRRFFH